MRRLLALAFALMTALAGCTGDSDAPAEETQEVHDEGGNQTIEAPGAEVLPMDLVFTIETAGLAPATVNFTLDLTNATDAANATWTVVAGEVQTNGTGLPAAGNLTLEAGNHTLTATIAINGTQWTSAHNLTIEPGVTAGEYIQTVTFSDAGSLVSGFQWCGFQDGFDRAAHSWDASALIAQNYAVANIQLQFSVSETTGQMHLEFYDPAGTEVAELEAGHVVGSMTSEMTFPGPFPAGEFQFLAKVCTGVAPDYSFELTADLVTA